MKMNETAAQRGWDDELPGCMPGPFIAPFGQHPHDKRRALAWADSLRNRRLGWDDARRQIEAYLVSEGASAGDIQAQIKRASSLIGPLLR
jgi:hypothetical protein